MFFFVNISNNNIMLILIHILLRIIFKISYLNNSVKKRANQFTCNEIILDTYSFIWFFVVFFLFPRTEVLKEDLKLKKNIQLAVITQIAIDFSKETYCGWGKMVVFPPYADLKTKFKKYNIRTNIDEIQSTIESNDGINLIVFVKNHGIVSYINYEIDKGDFHFNYNQVLSRENSTFLINHDKNNRLIFFK